MITEGEEIKVNRKFLFVINVKTIKNKFLGMPSSMAVIAILFLAFTINIMGIIYGAVDTDNLDNLILSSIRIIPGILLLLSLATNKRAYANCAYLLYCMIYAFYLVFFIGSLFYYIIWPPGPVDDYSKASYYTWFYILYIFLSLLVLVVDYYFIFVIFCYIESLTERGSPLKRINTSFSTATDDPRVIQNL